MVKLKNITIENNIVKCGIIPEDSPDNDFIEVDISSNQILDYALPLDYEWCKSHIQHAKNYILTTYTSKKTLPAEKTLMWY